MRVRLNKGEILKNTRDFDYYIITHIDTDDWTTCLKSRKKKTIYRYFVNVYYGSNISKLKPDSYYKAVFDVDLRRRIFKIVPKEKADKQIETLKLLYE